MEKSPRPLVARKIERSMTQEQRELHYAHYRYWDEAHFSRVEQPTDPQKSLAEIVKSKIISDGYDLEEILEQPRIGSLVFLFKNNSDRPLRSYKGRTGASGRPMDEPNFIKGNFMLQVFNPHRLIIDQALAGTNFLVDGYIEFGENLRPVSKTTKKRSARSLFLGHETYEEKFYEDDGRVFVHLKFISIAKAIRVFENNIADGKEDLAEAQKIKRDDPERYKRELEGTRESVDELSEDLDILYAELSSARSSWERNPKPLFTQTK